MIRGPPASPLFPYTPLFLSSAVARQGDDDPAGHVRHSGDDDATRSTTRTDDSDPASKRSRNRRGRGKGSAAGEDNGGDRRSEEHTSELQSRQYLVCRLLLEK